MPPARVPAAQASSPGVAAYRAWQPRATGDIATRAGPDPSVGLRRRSHFPPEAGLVSLPTVFDPRDGCHRLRGIPRPTGGREIDMGVAWTLPRWETLVPATCVPGSACAPASSVLVDAPPGVWASAPLGHRPASSRSMVDAFDASAPGHARYPARIDGIASIAAGVFADEEAGSGGPGRSPFLFHRYAPDEDPGGTDSRLRCPDR